MSSAVRLVSTRGSAERQGRRDGAKWVGVGGLIGKDYWWWQILTEMTWTVERERERERERRRRRRRGRGREERHSQITFTSRSGRSKMCTQNRVLCTVKNNNLSQFETLKQFIHFQQRKNNIPNLRMKSTILQWNI